MIISLTNLLIRENSNEALSRKMFLTAGGIHVLDLSNSTKILSFGIVDVRPLVVALRRIKRNCRERKDHQFACTVFNKVPLQVAG